MSTFFLRWERLPVSVLPLEKRRHFTSETSIGEGVKAMEESGVSQIFIEKSGYVHLANKAFFSADDILGFLTVAEIQVSFRGFRKIFEFFSHFYPFSLWNCLDA